MKLEITNMTCGHCKITIEKALKENGFDQVDIDLDTKIVDVELNGKSKDEVRKIIETKGYIIKQ